MKKEKRQKKTKLLCGAGLAAPTRPLFVILGVSGKDVVWGTRPQPGKMICFVV